jgi:hypothetical protein
MRNKKNYLIIKNSSITALAVLLIVLVAGKVTASGLFGPLQTVSREAGGLNTAIGYTYHEDKFKNGSEYIIRQNQIYSQVAYGSHNSWEIYGRLGVSDLKIFDAFSSTVVSTTTFNNDFTENWKFFGTLGAKGYIPINKIFGVGAFLQGSYYFSYFTDDIVGANTGVPFAADLKLQNLWDVNLGIGFQATIPGNIKLYTGPYVYYSEAKIRLSDNIPGMRFGTDNVLFKNASIVGAFIGADIPLAKGFHLNIEAQYSERFSTGTAITYSY